jgi:hypothetical protein
LAVGSVVSTHLIRPEERRWLCSSPTSPVRTDYGVIKNASVESLEK